VDGVQQHWMLVIMLYYYGNAFFVVVFVGIIKYGWMDGFEEQENWEQNNNNKIRIVGTAAEQ